MADFRLGRLKFKWRGDWVASTAYVIDDIVKYGANSYVCVVNHTSSANQNLFYTNDISKWQLHTEGLRNRGDWTANTWYAINDLVKYGNSIYRCILGHTSGVTDFAFSSFTLYAEGLKFEDTWNSTTTYQKGDVVTFGGYTYVAEQNSTNVAPNTDTAYWKVLTTGYLSQGDYNFIDVYEPGNTVKFGGNNYACRVTTNDETISLGVVSGNGTVVTVNFLSPLPSAPFGIRDEVVISGVSVAPYNGTYRVLSCTTTGFTYSSPHTTVGGVGGTVTYRPVPTNTRFWDLVLEGFNWTGQWNGTSVYQLGDVVNRSGNSYVCINSNTLGAATAPELDPNGIYWNYLSQGGNAAQVLQEVGDLLYLAAGGINRIALPLGDGSPTALREASGQVLTVGGNPLLPRWEQNSVSASIYYVTLEGSNSYNGRSISRAFASLRYACDYLASLSGAAAPSESNPITIFVKAGVYREVLPITIPRHVSVIGDNLRATIVKPKAGNSDLQALTLASPVSHILFGDTIENAAGTKIAKVLDSDYSNNVHLLNISGGTWDNNDKYINIISHKAADARNLIIANKDFIAAEAYARVANQSGPPAGNPVFVKQRLAQFAESLAFNVKAGQNNKVWEFVNTVITGQNLITGFPGQDVSLIDQIDEISIDVMRNILITRAPGNTLTQIRDLSITPDTAAPYCANVASSINTLVGIAKTAIASGNLSGTAKTEPYITISTAATRSNAESTMFYVGSHSVVKDMIFGDMTGYVPATGLIPGTNELADRDIGSSTIKGVYFRLDPSNPIQKSPYIQNCATIGGAAVGIIIDGSVHSHFDNTSTPSNKSMIFDSFTQILDGGVGFYVTKGAASEIVSCFTYYCHISYTSTYGGKIRAVSGNSSYGKYGCISRGYDPTETTIDGKISGKRLHFNSLLPKNGVFTPKERITGATSGAIGEFINDQTASGFIYYLPIRGTFAQGEKVTGASSGAYVTLFNNTDAVTGQKGFVLVAEQLSNGPDQGGSVELIDNGTNDDGGSYVISNSSYSNPDGRGTLTVSRAQLGSAAAAAVGATGFNLYSYVATPTPTTLGSSIDQTTTDLFVSSIIGMTGTSYIIIDQEMMKIGNFTGGDSFTVTRGVEGTSAVPHSSGSVITVLASKVSNQDEIIQDISTTSTALRVAKANIVVKPLDYIKLGNEFLRLTAVTPDTTGITVLFLSDQKTIAAGDGQSFKIRYRYSQVRLTAHDFLDVGTGSKQETNWPFLPANQNIPAHETIESRPGRVYYVSTDQDGNFSVGKFFRVEQATGKATLDASAFDLSGLESLRLGSIGAQLGASINEFSTDGTLSQNSDEKVATQKAVKTYVDNMSGSLGNFTVGGNLTVKGTTTTVSSVTVETKDRNITLGKVVAGAFNGNISSGSPIISNISDTTNLAPGVAVSITSGSGSVTLGSTARIISVTATTVTLTENFGGPAGATATGTVFAVSGATDFTADSGGITILGTTNKEFSWLSSNNAFNSTESIALASGKSLIIGSTTVLTSTTVLGLTLGDTDAALGGSTASNTKIPTQLAVKTFVEKYNGISAANYFVAAM